MNEMYEKLKKLEDAKLIDVVSNYKQYVTEIMAYLSSLFIAMTFSSPSYRNGEGNSG